MSAIDSHGRDFCEFQAAIRLFNAQSFFECHEVLEDLWRPLAAGPEKQFLQGLLQVGVGFHHLQRHNFTGARNLLQAGLEKLEAVAAQSVYHAPIRDLDSLIQRCHLALATLLKLGHSQLAEFPPELIPRIARTHSPY